MMEPVVDSCEHSNKHPKERGIYWACKQLLASEKQIISMQLVRI
jgi:hypothetical protein